MTVKIKKKISLNNNFEKANSPISSLAHGSKIQIRSHAQPSQDINARNHSEASDLFIYCIHVQFFGELGKQFWLPISNQIFKQKKDIRWTLSRGHISSRLVSIGPAATHGAREMLAR